jgi:hypothetical protein
VEFRCLAGVELPDGVIRSSLRFIVPIVGRFNRVVFLDTPHHATLRGNARHFIFNYDADRTVCLKLLRENMAFHGAHQSETVLRHRRTQTEATVTAIVTKEPFRPVTRKIVISNLPSCKFRTTVAVGLVS